MKEEGGRNRGGRKTLYTLDGSIRGKWEKLPDYPSEITQQAIKCEPKKATVA